MLEATFHIQYFHPIKMKTHKIYVPALCMCRETYFNFKIGLKFNKIYDELGITWASELSLFACWEWKFLAFQESKPSEQNLL